MVSVMESVSEIERQKQLKLLEEQERLSSVKIESAKEPTPIPTPPPEEAIG